ncbi:PREDICTED: mucin-17 [Theobroma cacao]|uniref:Mucin-17 n=1 Tax=Theobroma cacao TaxID=3641 RepID=A0AB32VHW3_THECC|nr:PREDICTED: mucin-17 [Theobroma cacao]
MERSEPSLVPEWLKSGGSVTGSGNSNHQFTSSSLHSDNHSALRPARNKLSVAGDHDVGGTSVLDRTTSAYFRRSSSSNGSVHLRSYSSFTKGHRDRDWDKDINGYHDREKSVISDHRNRNFSDSLDNMLPSVFEKDVLWRSQSITGKRSDTWPKKVTSDSSTSNKSNHSSGNGLLSGVSTTVGNKSAFEREFPVLGAEERQVGSEIGRVSSPGLSTAGQSLPVGTSAISGSDGWTSALADMPAGVGSSGTGVAVASQNVSASSASMASTTMTGLNMAETLVQGPSRARTPPLLNVGTQRLEELAIKQSRQLVPLVTTSTPKILVVSPSEKSKPKVGQQQHASLSLNYTRGGTSRSDSLKVSNEGRLRILKPSRELNGVSLMTKDNLSPTNGSSKLVNSPLNVTPSASASAPFRSSGNSPSFATAERNQTPFRINIEKRPTAQAQSRNDFFNLLKKKSTTNSPSSVADRGPAASPSVSEKSDELGTEDASTSVTLQGGSVPSSEISIADLPTDNRSEITHNGDAYAGSQQCSSNGDRHARPDAFLYPDEEEAAFLRSLGWEENAGDDEGLTEEEISAFFEEHMKLKPSAKLFHRMQSIVPLNSHNGTHDGASSGLSSMDSN